MPALRDRVAEHAAERAQRGHRRDVDDRARPGLAMASPKTRDGETRAVQVQPHTSSKAPGRHVEEAAVVVARAGHVAAGGVDQNVDAPPAREQRSRAAAHLAPRRARRRRSAIASPPASPRSRAPGFAPARDGGPAPQPSRRPLPGPRQRAAKYAVAAGHDGDAAFQGEVAATRAGRRLLARRHPRTPRMTSRVSWSSRSYLSPRAPSALRSKACAFSASAVAALYSSSVGQAVARNAVELLQQGLDLLVLVPAAAPSPCR